MSKCAWSKCTGFTIVELIITITIIGILAAVAVPRFINRDSFDSVGFANQAESVIRYAQKVAIAKRHNVCVSIAVGAVSLNYSTAVLCDTALTLPSDQTNTLNAPNGVTLTSAIASFYFDSLGRPFNVAGNVAFAAPLTITITASPSRTLTVERETGYVHQ
jgi:MSHA pilin protein MshC